MKVIGIIPARFESTRFPGKPLIDINGKSMINRVYEQASRASSLDELIVATDDKRIRDHVMKFGGKSMITSAAHVTGTERCNEASFKAGGSFDIVVNIQGDEPFIMPESINTLVDSFDEETDIATLYSHPTDSEDISDPNVIKVVINHVNNALYFSRSAIPYKDVKSGSQFLKHIGIYAYRSSVLADIVKLAPSQLEISERLEQLRWLEAGYKIKCTFTPHSSISIDAPEDLNMLTKPLNE